MEDQEKITQDAAAKEKGKDAFEWVSSLVSAVLIITLLFTFVVRMMGVDGFSMYPTLVHADRLIVLNAPFCGEYRQGDVVIARKESFLKEPIVKRVIAVGGQTVDINFSLGVVFVDGVALEEPYINENTYTPEGVEFPLTVPEGSVFLMGDNRNHSTDSRYIGAVDNRYLIGKVLFMAFPGTDPNSNARDFKRIGAVG